MKSIGRDIDLQKTDSELDQDMGLLDKIDNENLDLLDNEAVIIENPVVENQNMEAEDEDGEMVMLNKDEYEASLRAALEKQPARPKPSVNKATIGKGTFGKGTVGKLTTGKATVGKGTVGKEKMILDHEAAQNRTFEVELSDGDEMMILDKEEFERSMRVESSQNASEPEPIQSAQPILILEEEKPVMETETPEPQEEVAVQEVVRDVQVQVQVQAEQNVSTQESVQEPLQKKNTEEEVVLIVPRESEPASGKVSLAKDNVIAPIFLSQKPSVSRLVEINGVRSGVESCKKIGTIVAPGSLSLKNSVAKLNSNKSSVIKIDSNTNTPSGSNKKRKYDAIQESIQQLSNGISGVSQELKKLKKSDTPIQLSNGKTGSLFKQIQQHMLQTPEVKIPNLGIKPSGVKSEVKFMMKENIPNEPNQGSSVKKLEVQNAMKLSSLKPIRTCAFCERPVEKAQSKTLSCLHRAHNVSVL